ncbi:HAMP domain-containing sensor histidine kinase [Bdellovibrio bacteriovorus]|uniref:histidine kinase n=1 Tax=Bdellovibrio bacteriovorus TaxID=959 RepID=A0A150WVK8_BDEBC|nr:HAMP domain-containing sensor histidine kinase [Bdellovibrio bacteriovorus]KYG70464.1 two-component sensor histidine kinase [Bdellovibrio bacteriovorus]
MLQKLLKPQVKTALAIVWFVFTFSLVAWWWVFFLLRLNPNTTTLEQMKMSHRMFVWEGSILLAAILLGGISLVVFTYRDQKRHQRLRFFFSTFSHDIKTSIARLRLQAEVLEEDITSASSPILKRLIADIQRLDLQLENSLLLANLEDGELLHEDVSLRSIFSSLRNEFPELSIELEREATIRGDHRALLSVFKNLLQNSVLHGKATTVRIKIKSVSDNRIELQMQDDGLGFKGPVHKLGSEILKSQDSRSNGLGLLITSRLLKRMNGHIRYDSRENEGFKSYIELEGQLK